MLNIKNVAIPKNLSFLIVEDSNVMQKILSKSLKHLGFCGDIYGVPSLLKAQEIFTSVKIDFILLDWNLEDGTGDIFLRALRMHQQFADIPVLMVSSNDDMDSILKMMNEGASDYLVKPPEIEDFQEKLSNAWLKHNPDSVIEES